MKNYKYKILVLSDLKKSTNATLKNTIGLAKKFDADIELFHVKKPTEVVERESQLSAVRNINEQSLATDKKIKKLLEPITIEENIIVNYKYTIGNIKEEIKAHIKQVNPDIIVIGRKKSKILNFIGDNLTGFLIKNFNGAVMIASNDNPLEFKKDWNLGLFNDFDESINMKFVEQLIDDSNSTLRSFKVGLQKSNLNNQEELKTDKIVEYVFEDNPNVIEKLYGYISKNKIGLLILDRTSNNSKNTSYLNEVINKMNISVLVT